jgi:hypothetical protein
VWREKVRNINKYTIQTKGNMEKTVNVDKWRSQEAAKKRNNILFCSFFLGTKFSPFNHNTVVGLSKKIVRITVNGAIAFPCLLPLEEAGF